MLTSDAALLSPGAVARLLDCSTRTVTRWAEQGRLGEIVYTEGGQRRYTRAAVEAFQAAQQDGEAVA